MPAARREVAGTLECTRATTGSLGRIACMVTDGNTGSGIDLVILLRKFSQLGMSADVENRPISRVMEMARTFLFWRLDGICIPHQRSLQVGW